MPSTAIALTQPQFFVVTLPDGRVEVTANGYEGKSRRIVQFELLPGQAESLATDLVRALARAAAKRPRNP